MRCQCCGKILSDYEATMKHAETMEYLDTCRKCLKGLGIPVLTREDLYEASVEEDECIEESEYDVWEER